MTQITRDLLMAFADGQLGDADRAAVEAHLAVNPDAATEVATQQRQSDAIRTLFGPVGAEPVPARLKPARLAAEQGRRNWGLLQRAAMIVALVGIGLVGGWFLRPVAEGKAYEQLIANAVSAHTVYVAESRHAVEVAGSDSEHLTSWLSNRLDTTLAMPDLSAEGLAFMGGRLLPAPAIPGGRAAQLMYETASGERLTLYITPASGVTGPNYEAVNFGADTALYWSNDAITCTIVGDQTADAMQPIAKAVFSQLTPGPVDDPLYRG